MRDIFPLVLSPLGYALLVAFVVVSDRLLLLAIGVYPSTMIKVKHFSGHILAELAQCDATAVELVQRVHERMGRPRWGALDLQGAYTVLRELEAWGVLASYEKHGPWSLARAGRPRRYYRLAAAAAERAA